MQTGYSTHSLPRLVYALFAFSACSFSEKDPQNIPTPIIQDSGFLEPGTRDLVAFDQWSILPDEADPFPTHRTDQHSCHPDGVLPEEEVLEINTGDCGYAVVGQPLLSALSPGDTVELLMYHSALSSTDENAEAHFSLLIADHVFWDIEIDIPWQSEVYIVSKVIDWSATKDALVRVHLHNHGGNSWRVGYLRRER